MSDLSPSLAVIIPMRDGSADVSSALDSLAGQTSPVDEVIVVDDGSTDGGDNVARAHRLAPLVLRGPGRGVAFARNRGAAASSSEWVGFLDHDDLWHPRRVELMRASLANHPEWNMLATSECAFALSRDRPALAGTLRENMVEAWSDDPDAIALGAERLLGPCGTTFVTLDELRYRPRFLTTSMCLSRETFFELGGFSPLVQGTDDYWLLVTAAVLGPIPILDEPLLFYRVRPGSGSSEEKLAARYLAATAAADATLGGDYRGTRELVDHFLLELARSARSRGQWASLLGHYALHGTRRGARPLVKAGVRSVFEQLLPEREPRRCVRKARSVN